MASDFWLIVGLGNPGKKYQWARSSEQDILSAYS